MARTPTRNRPKNREVEHEMLKPPEREGQPPRPATEPKKRRAAPGDQPRR